jgi:hypothetical protein
MKQRRHACPQCSQTYLRATHLHSHLRTHLSEEDRPFACDKEDCGKKFWTAAHLKRHQDVHDQAKVYQVSYTLLKGRGLMVVRRMLRVIRKRSFAACTCFNPYASWYQTIPMST